MTLVSSQPPKPASATSNLRTLCLLRSLVLAVQIGAVVIAGQVLGWMLPFSTLSTLFIAIGAFTALGWLRSFAPWPVSQTELFANLCVDVIGFSAVMYFSGGASNPFISYLLVPLSISATALALHYTWALTALSAGAYSLLLFFYVPLAAMMPHHNHGGLSPHILGMWANFVVSAVLITLFVFKMAQALRQREAELARSRERSLQDEQLLAVATLAAGTAHELGTPLSTIKVIGEDLDDMITQGTPPGELAREVDALNSQIQQCQAILQKLVRTAREFSNLEDERLSLGEFTFNLLERWQLLRPGFAVQLTMAASLKPLPLRLDATVSQALLNLINNAADASPNDIDLRVEQTREELVFTIADRGSGRPATISEVPSSKKDGLGLGLKLSHATAARYGGSLRWLPREGGGSDISLHLPLDRISP